MTTDEDFVELHDEPDRGNPLTAELESSPNHYREAASRALDFIKESVIRIRTYKGSRDFALDCWILSMGWHDIINVRTQDELAARYKKINDPLNSITKASVSKLVKQFQEELRIPPALGQRKVESCKTMRKTREKQLNRKTP